VYIGIANVKEMHKFGISDPSIIDSHSQKKGPPVRILTKGPKLSITFIDS